MRLQNLGSAGRHRPVQIIALTLGNCSSGQRLRHQQAFERVFVMGMRIQEDPHVIYSAMSFMQAVGVRDGTSQRRRSPLADAGGRCPPYRSRLSPRQRETPLRTA